MSKKISVTNSAAKTAYHYALTLHSPEWDSVLGAESFGILACSAARLETSLTSIVANILAAVSTVVGPSTEVVVRNQLRLKANIYLMLVSQSGSGKSQAFEYFFLEPMQKLELEKAASLIMEEFTPAGFLRSVADKNGHAVFASDEFCQHMKPKISSRNDESLALRSHLNKFYNGKGISKAFSTKGPLKIDSVYLTVLGLAQPQPYANFHGEMVASMDGLLGRFMVMCAPAVPTETTNDDDEQEQPAGPAPQATKSYKSSDEWVTAYYARIYDLHHGPQRVVYRLSDDAKHFLETMRAITLDEKRHVHNEVAEKIRQQVFKTCDLPEDDTDAKDFEYVIKFGLLLHIISHTIQRGASFRTDFTIPEQVERDSLERAQHLMLKTRRQQREFSKIFTDVITSLEEAGQLLNVMVKEPETLVRTILMFPGKAVAANMVTRKRKNTRALDVSETMQQLSKKTGEAAYVGQFKSVGRKTHVFYKAPIAKCDVGFLSAQGISEEEYTAKYDSDMTTAPVTGIPKWNEFYATLTAETPANI